MAGLFITLEGTEGVGKSTNLAFVERYLRDRGREVVVTREPGGTDLGEKVRGWILDADHGALSAEVETLLMFAARAQHLDRVIRPAISAAKCVVCDRFTDATFRLSGRCPRGRHRNCCQRWSACSARARTPPDTAARRAARHRPRTYPPRRPDHFEREDRRFFERVREAYLDLAKHQPTRIKVIDASRPLTEVQASIAGELQDLLDAEVG